MIEIDAQTKDSITMMQLLSMPKESKMRFLLNKFSTQKWVSVPSDDWEQFCEFLKLNSLLKKPLELSLDTWFFINEKSKVEWLRMHPDQEVLDSKVFTDPDNFIEIAREHRKVEDARGSSTIINLPGTHFKPPVESQITQNTQKAESTSELPSYLGKKKAADKSNIFTRKSTYNNATQIDELSKSPMDGFKESKAPPFVNNGQNNVLSDIKSTIQSRQNNINNTQDVMTIEDDNSENMSPVKRSLSPKKSKAMWQSQMESSAAQKFKIEPMAQVKKMIVASSPYAGSQIPPAYRTMYPVNVNVSPPGDEMLKQAHTTLHQDMIRMTKRFDFFMHKFLKLEEDLQQMKTNFEKVVDFATKSMSRREKQALLADLKQTSKPAKKKDGENDDSNTNSVKCDPDDDEYDILIKKEQLKLLQKQRAINTNIYTAEIDPNSRVDSFTQWRKQTQLEISTQLQKSSELIDVPEVLRKQRQHNGERKIKAKDLKEDNSEKQDFEPSSKSKKLVEDLRLDPETMLSMLAEDDSKDQKEEEKEEKKRRRKKKEKTTEVKTQNYPVPKAFDESKHDKWDDEELEPDLPDEDIGSIADDKIGLFDEDPDMIGANFDEDME